MRSLKPSTSHAASSSSSTISPALKGKSATSGLAGEDTEETLEERNKLKEELLKKYEEVAASSGACTTDSLVKVISHKLDKLSEYLKRDDDQEDDDADEDDEDEDDEDEDDEDEDDEDEENNKNGDTLTNEIETSGSQSTLKEEPADECVDLSQHKQSDEADTAEQVKEENYWPSHLAELNTRFDTLDKTLNTRLDTLDQQLRHTHHLISKMMSTFDKTIGNKKE
ncbi:trigger factor-like [Procambarus clarkii]|uniref:trigger factor-like n=1 Tax=Procambarus clarkii TaxID=6728 RepID=UPI00374353D8